MFDIEIEFGRLHLFRPQHALMRHWCWYLCLLSALLWATAQSQALAADRIIEFPTASVGSISTTSQGMVGYFCALGPVKSAIGRVKVPADAQIALTVNYYGASHLSFLRQLKSNDLTSLQLSFGTKGFEEINNTSVADIVRLKGLKEVNLSNSDVNDGVFTTVAAMPELKSLFLEGTMITKAGPKALKKMTGLNFLSLNYTAIDDRSMQGVEDLQNLQGLELKHCNLTAEGMSYLHKLTHLRDLTLSENDIGDKGLAVLPAMSELIGLGISDSGITDGGLPNLRKFPSLKALDLKNCHVTKFGLRQLSQLTKLEQLNVAGSTFTVDELKQLKRFPSLKEITLSIDAKKLAGLKQLLPHCKIVVDNKHNKLNPDKLPLDLFAPLH